MNIAVGANPQQSIRRALGVLKDSTSVGLVKVNSEYKGLDVAIVKATNHFELLPKEKHVRTIFQAVSASRPRPDVAYCIHNLVKRLARTSSWVMSLPMISETIQLSLTYRKVALKTLVVIHRALRETDRSFREELLKYRRKRAQMLNLSHFKDDSSTTAWEYSAWVRTYALFLEERLECSRVLKYDIESESNRFTELETSELLEHLPALQNLLFRLVGCQPEGAAVHNQIIRFAISMVAQESIKIYAAIRTGTANLVDKFFDMQRHDAIRALDIYRKAVQQAGSLTNFYKTCKCLNLGQVNDFKKVEQPPESFLGAMEEYIKNVPRHNMLENGRETLAIQYKNNIECGPPVETSSSSREVILPETHSAETSVQTAQSTSFSDLLCLEDATHDSTSHQVQETNPLALALISNETPTNDACSSSNPTYAMADWELALITASSSNQSSPPEIKLDDGFSKLMLDSLYENSVPQGPTSTELGFPISSDHAVPLNPFEMVSFSDDPAFAPREDITSSNMELGTNVEQNDLFFWSNTETITSNIVPTGFEAGQESLLSLPSTEEVVPSSDLPLGTEVGHDDAFIWPSTEINPGNAALDPENGDSEGAILQVQGQEITHDSTKNPFGNPFM